MRIYDGVNYKMIGNAVPVNLAYHIAMSIRAVLARHNVSYGQNDDEVIARCRRLFESNRRSIPTPKKTYTQLNFLDLYDQFALDAITTNSMVQEDEQYGVYGKERTAEPVGDKDKNVLISLVKDDNKKLFLDGSATLYYTGKRFPTTVALNKLYYFMPYIKGKGVRDLYFIKIARLGYRKEGTPEEDKNDLRLVFEMEFVKQMFDDYKPIELEIWRTFKDTTIGNLLDE